MAPPQICFAEFAKEEKDLQANPRIAARVRAVKGISPSAEGDQHPKALDPCRLLKKAKRAGALTKTFSKLTNALSLVYSLTFPNGERDREAVDEESGAHL